MLRATRGGSEAVRVCLANPCLACVQTSPHPASGAKEMPALRPLTQLWSLASVLAGAFLLNETLRDSGTGIQEGAKFLCPQPSFSTLLPHYGLLQLTFNIFQKMFIGGLRQKAISSSNQDTWVKKNNCRTFQSLYFAQRMPKEVVFQSYLSKEFFFSRDTYYLCCVESSIGIVVLWSMCGYSASCVVMIQAPFLMWLPASFRPLPGCRAV